MERSKSKPPAIIVFCLLSIIQLVFLAPYATCYADGGVSIGLVNWDGSVKVNLSRGDINSVGVQEKSLSKQVITHTFFVLVEGAAGEQASLSFKVQGPVSQGIRVSFEPAVGSMPLTSEVSITYSRWIDVGVYSITLTASSAGRTATRTIKAQVLRAS